MPVGLRHNGTTGKIALHTDPQISGLSAFVPFRQEGRIAIVTNVVRDVVDARASARKRDRRAG